MNNDLSWKVVLAGVIAVVSFVMVMLYMMRLFSLAVSPVEVIDVAPGVQCARMVTTDGAAISCWRVEK